MSSAPTVATAVRAAASTMEAAAASGSADVAAAMIAAAAVVAARSAAAVTATIAAIYAAAALIGVAASAIVTAAPLAVVGTATVATVSAAVKAVSVAMEPRAGADEDAAYEIIRSVEAVGRAGVWSIVVVAVSANWRVVIGRAAYSDAEGDALGLRVRSGEETNSETNAE